MQKIPNSYSKNGFDYTLVARVGRVAIYEQRKDNKLWAFEVCWVRERAAREFKGVVFPAGERLPSDAEWGLYGKTYSLAGRLPVTARKAADAMAGAWAIRGPRGAC